MMIGTAETDGGREIVRNGQKAGDLEKAGMAHRVARLLRSEGRAGLELRHVSKDMTEITVRRVIGRSVRITMTNSSIEIERPLGNVLYQVSSRGFMASVGVTPESLPKDFSYNPWKGGETEETQDGVKIIRALLPNIASAIERYPNSFNIYKSSGYIWDTDFV